MMVLTDKHCSHYQHHHQQQQPSSYTQHHHIQYYAPPDDSKEQKANDICSTYAQGNMLHRRIDGGDEEICWVSRV